jgi:hypothetical protein
VSSSDALKLVSVRGTNFEAAELGAETNHHVEEVSGFEAGKASVTNN